jgi:hypothetical protein
LVEHDGAMVLSRVGATAYVCRAGKTRRLGVVPDPRIETSRYVSYRVGSVTGIFDAVKGERRELDGEVAVAAPRLLAAGPAGLRLWPDVELAPGPASEPAFGPGRVVYWLDGAGTPQLRVLPG